MVMMDANHTQQVSQSLPPATLVIDLRGMDEDDVMDRLRVETSDLCTEMNVRNIHHWRYLTDFLSFWDTREIAQMRVEEVESLRQHQAIKNPQAPSPTVTPAPEAPDAPDAAVDQTLYGVTGKIDQSKRGGYASHSVYDDDEAISAHSNRPLTETIQHNVQKIIKETNRLRNNRNVAVDDYHTSHSAHHFKDPTVRVIFITDAENPDTLASAAAYAEYLRCEMLKLKRQDQMLMLSTTVICLNVSGDTTPSPDMRELLWNEAWEHFDSLILSEYFALNANYIAGEIQSYLAELLLYVLLLVPPLVITMQADTAQNLQAQSTTSRQAPGQQGKSIAFPPYTIVVGLAAMEHSARWGRRLLNYKVVEKATEVLLQECEDDSKGVVSSWLTHWRNFVASAIPDQVPGNITALQAIPNARNKITDPESIFTEKKVGLSIGKTTIDDLERYQSDLAQTYAPAANPQANEQTLKEAIESIPRIRQRLREWEGKDEETRRSTPLAQAQLQAQQVLSDSAFFIGATSAVPRARMQLEELAIAIGRFRSEHNQNPVNLEEMRKKLAQAGTRPIEALKQHIRNLPLLAEALGLKRLLGWLTLIIAFLLGGLAAIMGVAWGHHVIAEANVNNPGLASFVNNLLLFSLSPLAFIFWLVVLALVFALVYFLGRGLVDPQRTAWKVEIGFVLVLAIFSIFGWLISFLFTGLANDPVSLAVISWLSFLPVVAVIVLVVTILIVVLEIGYFVWWFTHLQSERVRIVRDANAAHTENINAVTGYIADSVALHLLERAGLINDKGESGDYNKRISKLNAILNDIQKQAHRQQNLARRRLTLSVSETLVGIDATAQGRWLNLRIRDELLNVQSLAEGYNRLTERLEQEIIELRGFAEVLVRAMGQETPAEIERRFREQSPSYKQQTPSQALMSTLTAVALRLSLSSTAFTGMSPLVKRYETLAQNDRSRQPLVMKSVIDTIRKRISQVMLQSIVEGDMMPNEEEMKMLAANAFAAWGQLLWEGKNTELDQALSDAGVLQKIAENSDHLALAKRLLGSRTSPFARNINTQQVGDLYVLLPPAPQTRQFRQIMNLPRRHFVEFPDAERLVLLYVHNYMSESLLLAAPEEPENLKDIIAGG